MMKLITPKLLNEPHFCAMLEDNHQSKCRNVDSLFISTLKHFNTAKKYASTEDDSKSFILGYN